MIISLQELKEMKRFPNGVDQVEVLDYAILKVKRTMHRGRYLYTGTTTFTYKNLQVYHLEKATRSLKTLIPKAIVVFEQRNRQMENSRLTKMRLTNG